MFESVGWGEILVLVVAGLFILGPERLPSAAAWMGKTMRQVREYATGRADQLRRELGPEFDELRKPLEDLRGLRDFNPRTPSGGRSSTTTRCRAGQAERVPAERHPGRPEHPPQETAEPAAPAALSPGERPPIDPDAT